MNDVWNRFDVLTCCRSSRTASWKRRWSTVVTIWWCAYHHSKDAQKKVRNESTTPSPNTGHERRQYACRLPQHIHVIKTTHIQIVPEEANKGLHFDKFWSICRKPILTRVVVCTKVLGKWWVSTSQWCGICVNGLNVAAEIGYTPQWQYTVAQTHTVASSFCHQTGQLTNPISRWTQLSIVYVNSVTFACCKRYSCFALKNLE